MQPEGCTPGIMITYTNIAGGDVGSGLERLLQALPEGTTTCIVELPDHGLPRLCHRLGYGRSEDWPATRSMERWMQDFARQEQQDVDHYLIEHEQQHYLCLHPGASSMNPVVPFALSQQTLIEIPLYIKLHLTRLYDVVIVLTQGTFIHPLTHFAIRYADGVLFASSSQLDVDLHEQAIQTLVNQYCIDADRLIHLIHRKKGMRLPLVYEYRIQDAVHHIQSLLPAPVFWRDEQTQWQPPTLRSGWLQPDAYRSFEYSRSEMARHQIRAEHLVGRGEAVQQLSFDLMVSAQGAAKVRMKDEMYEPIKRYLCEMGCQSSTHIRIQFQIRRQRVINILKALAEEGVLNRPTPHSKSYTLRWTREQVHTYLSKAQAALSPLTSHGSLPPTVPGTVPGTVPSE